VVKRVFKYLWLPLCLSCAIVVINVALFTKWGNWLNFSEQGRDFLKVILWLISLAPPLYALYRAETSCAMSETLTKSKELLEAAVKRLFEDEDLRNIRANYMVIDKKGDEKKLRIFASWNMDLYPDKDIRLYYGQGCAGVAWKRACEEGVREQWLPVVAPPGGALHKKWGLSEEQAKKTKHVMWVLSVPVFIKNRRGNPQLIGVLNFDGVQNLKNPGYLEMEQTHKDAADIAEAFGNEIKEYMPYIGDLCIKQKFWYNLIPFKRVSKEANYGKDN